MIICKMGVPRCQHSTTTACFLQKCHFFCKNGFMVPWPEGLWRIKFLSFIIIRKHLCLMSCYGHKTLHEFPYLCNIYMFSKTTEKDWRGRAQITQNSFWACLIWLLKEVTPFSFLLFYFWKDIMCTWKVFHFWWKIYKLMSLKYQPFERCVTKLGIMFSAKAVFILFHVKMFLT